jgi:hypothetical protein
MAWVEEQIPTPANFLVYFNLRDYCDLIIKTDVQTWRIAVIGQTRRSFVFCQAMQIGLTWRSPQPLPYRPVVRIQSLKITGFWNVTLCKVAQVVCPASIDNSSVSQDCMLLYRTTKLSDFTAPQLQSSPPIYVRGRRSQGHNAAVRIRSTENVTSSGIEYATFRLAACV